MYFVDIASVMPLLGLSWPLHHASKKRPSHWLDPHLQVVEQGLTKTSLLALKAATALSWQQLADILHISVRTLQRYQPDQVLSTPLSERLLHLADVYAKGYEVFEDRTMFQRWMQEPIPALGYTVPLSLLPSLYGMDAIMEELGRIEHGILA